jgi:hypothetical protein
MAGESPGRKESKGKGENGRGFKAAINCLNWHHRIGSGKGRRRPCATRIAAAHGW